MITIVDLNAAVGKLSMLHGRRPEMTEAERKASGDPRKSLEERYKDHDGYVKAVAKAARKLQKDGFLVEEDVQRFVDEAEASSVLR